MEFDWATTSRDALKYGALAGLGACALGGGLYWLYRKTKKVSDFGAALARRHHSTHTQESFINPYEAERINHVYMAFHYTPADEYLAHPAGPTTALDFPSRCAQLCCKHHQVYNGENPLIIVSVHL